MAKSAKELPTLLNLSEAYLETNKSKLSVFKIKIVIFHSEKPNGQHDLSFTYKGESIKIAPQIYLGHELAANGDWTEHIKLTISHGKVASFALLRQKHILIIQNMKMHKYLFITKVLPVAHYGYELWGPLYASLLPSILLLLCAAP